MLAFAFKLALAAAAVAFIWTQIVPPVSAALDSVHATLPHGEPGK